MTIPYFKRTEDSYVRRIEPRQPKSFPTIIQEARERIAAEMSAKTAEHQTEKGE